MSQDQTQHDKRREYWLEIGEYLTISGNPVHNLKDSIHVREVRPGERTFTLQEFHDAYSRAARRHFYPKEERDKGTLPALIWSELLPEGKSADEK